MFRIRVRVRVSVRHFTFLKINLDSHIEAKRTTLLENQVKKREKNLQGFYDD